MDGMDTDQSIEKAGTFGKIALPNAPPSFYIATMPMKRGGNKSAGNAKPANSFFRRDLHFALRADYGLANLTKMCGSRKNAQQNILRTQ